MATPSASPIPAAPSCPTTCRTIPARSPASWPGSTGWPPQNNGIEWLLSVPGDCPFLPDDLVERLHIARVKMGAGVPLACARSGEWRHPVVGLWPLALRANLRKALVEEGLRKIEVWTARHGVAVADWPAEPVDPFLNVNTPEDAARAEQVALQHQGI